MTAIIEPRAYTETRHTVYADVVGAEPMAAGERRRLFTPERIVVKYDWRTHVGPEEWSTGAIELSGRWVTVDGEPSGSGCVLMSAADAPDWARTFAATHRPTVPQRSVTVVPSDVVVDFYAGADDGLTPQ